MLDSIKKVGNFSIFKILILLFLFLFIPVFSTPTVKGAEDDCDKAEISVVAREFSGQFIPDLKFELYEQVNNVNGEPRPDKKTASGKIDAALGRGTVTFAPRDEEGHDYAIHIYDFDNDYGYWYYNDLYAGCGTVREVTEKLNAVKFSFFDNEDNVRGGTKFSLYEQVFDDSGVPLEQTGALIDSFTAESDGEKIVYIPHSSYTMDREGDNRIVMVAKNDNSDLFTKYNIVLEKDDTKEINYTFSDMKLTIRDERGELLLPERRVKIYEQDSKREVLGKFVKNLTTDAKGTVIFEYPEGTYVAQIEQKGKEVNFFNLKVNDEQRMYYNLRLDGTLESSKICASTDFTLNLKRYGSGRYITDPLSFELYDIEKSELGRQVAVNKVASGKIGESGSGKDSLKPDEYKTYALKVFDKNDDIGDFWFFDNIKFECGSDKDITKYLPSLKIILRDGSGELIRNQKFSIYTQKLDADKKPVREKADLVYSSFSTNEAGFVEIFIAPTHAYNQNKTGTYILVVPGSDGDFVKYNINIPISANVTIDYTLSDLVATVKNNSGNFLVGEKVDFYKQEQDSEGRNTLGKKINSYKVAENGEVVIEYPAGIYALVVNDSLKQKNIFWDIVIEDGKRTKKDIVTNFTRIGIKSASEVLQDGGNSIKIYSTKEISPNFWQRDKKLKTIKTAENKYAEISLAPGLYIFISALEKLDYGIVYKIENGKTQEITIVYKSTFRADADKKFFYTTANAKPESGSTLFERVKGKILLQVEGRGEAWYVDEDSGKRYYMKNGTVAYGMMRKFGLGVSNINIDKIPVGLDDRLNEEDFDKDGLSDKTEEALGTDIYNKDSDGDGHDDGVEVKNNYNPLGAGRKEIDNNLATRLKGKILLQVESLGQAWYINPENGKRYYMKNGDSAYEIMRFLSLGITNADLYKINEGIVD